MKLIYKNSKLENLCTNPAYNKDIKEKYGPEIAVKLPLRITQLEAFDNLSDVPTFPPYRRHKLEGKRKYEYAVNINKQFRLIFRTIKEEKDLKNIKEIEILEVSNHYE